MRQTHPHVVFALALPVIVLGFCFPRLYILQIIFWVPICVIALLLIAVVVLILRAVAADNQKQIPTWRQRQALRSLKFTTSDAWTHATDDSAKETGLSQSVKDNSAEESSLNLALDGLLNLVIQHFIWPWYARISPSPLFPQAVNDLMKQALEEMLDISGKIDWPNVIVSRLLPVVTDHFQHYRSIEHLSSTSSEYPALPLPLPSHPHPALSQSHAPSSISIEEHFRKTLKRVLPFIIQEQDQSPLINTIVREILLGAVVLPTFDMLSEGDFWNRQIDEKVGKYLHEQKQVDRFLSALSSIPASSSAANSPAKSKSQKSTSINANSSSNQFDVFLRSIRKLKRLGEARRLKADVERELRSAKLVLAKESRLSGTKEPESLKRARKYVERLEKAKGDIDLRIITLSGGKTPLAHDHSSSSILDSSHIESLTLYSILSNPSSLAYWLEYMERRQRTRLVQYWLTVEGFKDPLEAAGIGSVSQTTRDDTTIDDAKFLYNTYFVSEPEASKSIAISPRYLSIISNAAEREHSLVPHEIFKVKQAVYASQKEVYEQMEEDDWVTFRKSELFVKAVTDLQQAITTTPIVSPAPVLMPLPKKAPNGFDDQISSTRPLLKQLQTPFSGLRSSHSAISEPKSFSNFLPSIKPRNPTPPFLVNKTGARAMISNVEAISPLPLTRNFSDLKDMKREGKEASGDGEQLQLHLSPSLTPSPTLMLSPDMTAQPSPPPPTARRSSQLDFLIGSAEQNDESPNRSKLFADEPEETEDEEIKRMEAIQAALNEIIREEDDGRRGSETNFASFMDSQHEEMSRSMTLLGHSEKVVKKNEKREMKAKSVENLRRSSSVPASGTSPRSTSDRSNVLTRKSSTVLFEDNQLDDDLLSISSEEDMPPPETLPLPAAGDLHLSLPITFIEAKLAELSQQNHMLEALISQADLTGNQKELKILKRSQASVKREIRAKQWQKGEFERQESENRLIAARTKVKIIKAVAVDGPEGMSASSVGLGTKQVVKYIIQISQVENGTTILEWTVNRRYNDFWELDKGLKDWANGKKDVENQLKKLEIPGKKLVGGADANFVESRRSGLERYLQGLLISQGICDSPYLRSFLSRSPSLSVLNPSASGSALFHLAPHNLVKYIYKSILSGAFDESLLSSFNGIPGLGAPNMVDVVYSGLSRQINDLGGLVGLSVNSVNEDVGAAEVENMTTFTAPICDLFIELFDLREKDWFRRQAVVVILQQFLGGTIERRLRDSFRSATSCSVLERVLLSLQEMLFPKESRRLSSKPRSVEEKRETKARAGKKLALVIPDLATSLFGKSNARRATRRVFGALQDQRLNQHLLLSLLDTASFFPSKVVPSPYNLFRF
nr:hypothetical protein L204_01470 [Cryptococcus depauperatus CBS 7855]